MSLPNNVWLATDGLGLLYVCDTSLTPATFLGAYHLPQTEVPSQSLLPFKFNAAHVSEGSAVCVLSSRDVDEHGPNPLTSNGGHPAPQFHLWVVSIPLTSGDTSVLSPTPMQVLWQARGGSLPIYAGLDSTKTAFCILSGSQYQTVGQKAPPTYEPTPDEIAPVPRAGENLDLDVRPPNEPEKPPPYSWTQTSDSVTVAFPVPSHVPKTAIKVTLTPRTLSLTVNAANTTPIDLPRYLIKPLWDGISPSSSFWTWDKEGAKTFGLLTLHLDKQHEGTRWSHVFATSGTKPADEISDPTDVDVPETLDPSELYQIREALEKYTTALRNGEDASGLGLGSGIPSLAHGEMDAVDANVGRAFIVSWIGMDGHVSQVVEGLPSTLLSTPLPGLTEPTSPLTLMVKSDIDGLLYEQPNPLSPTLTWTHSATFPALSFVLASKQDLRFTFHASTEMALAFESGTGPGGGNLYIYYRPLNKDNWAKQSILRVSGAEKGALLGVGLLKTQTQEKVLVCLTEREIVLVKNVL